LQNKKKKKTTRRQQLPLKFIISGGGTGGHIFPAVAIAKSLQNRFPDVEILFIGAEGRMEMEKIPQEGFKIVGLKVAGLKRSISLSNFKVIFQFISAYFIARKIIKAFKPDCIIGTGGYASLAVLYASKIFNIPSLIWEGNGYAGLTNRILAKRVSTICTGFAGMEKFFPKNKIVYTGNPVRNEILNIPDKKAGADFFKLNDTQPIVFITGGSLGARTINQSIQARLNNFTDAGVQIIWQTGKKFQPVLDSSNTIISMPFCKEMNMAYAAADLVISRAGALSVSEIAVVKKPAILVPSPNVTEDHQTQNAKKLSDVNAAILIADADASTHLVDRAIALVKSPAELARLKENIEKMAMPLATENIVNEIEKLISHATQ
jgi:UDP-N-acetylglucosamine--N-acetylmuramyl-(pentapeptide) pyrophosphoryl-undecaprenol N-acetylglucosamine transferase